MSETRVAQPWAEIDRVNRQSLRENVAIGGSFDEREVSLTNPRALHRHLILELEDLGYTIHSGVDELIDVKKEVLGDYTGHFTSKIVGKREVYGAGEVEYRRISRTILACGIILVLIGIVALLTVTVVAGLAIIILALIVFIIGWFTGKKRSPVDVVLEDGVGIYVQGEVTEKLVQRGGDRVTELEGNALVSVGSICNIRAVPNTLDGGATAALLKIEPRAFWYHYYATSALLTVINDKTKEAVASRTAALKRDVDAVISRLSKYSAVRVARG